MKLIDLILNPKYATKEGKETIISRCCPSNFGLQSNSYDCDGLCMDCWNKEINVEQ